MQYEWFTLSLEAEYLVWWWATHKTASRRSVDRPIGWAKIGQKNLKLAGNAHQLEEPLSTTCVKNRHWVWTPVFPWSYAATIWNEYRSDWLKKNCFQEEVRTLLVRYVVKHLISDAAIEKWKTESGGDDSRSVHQKNLEKWPWRALWDVNASEELRRLYLTRIIMAKQQGRRDLGSSGSGSIWIWK